MNRPVDPWTGNPAALTESQERALDPTYMAEHPNDAALERYYNPFYGPQTGAYQLGATLRDKLMAPNIIGRQLDKGPWTGAATLGGIGAVGGGIAGAITDAFTHNSGTAARLATLLGLGGAALGGLSGHMRQPQDKAASWREGEDSVKEQLIEAINNAQMMNFNDRMRATAAVPQLNAFQAQQLLSQVSMLGGAAAGAAIMRFLFGAGLMGTLAGGFMGGMLGRSFNPPYRPGPLGMPSMSGYDLNGNPLF